MLHCPSRSRARDLLLKEVTSIDADSPIWNDPSLIKALSQYITSTKTGFPLEMTLDFPSPPEDTGLSA